MHGIWVERERARESSRREIKKKRKEFKKYLDEQ